MFDFLKRDIDKITLNTDGKITKQEISENLQTNIQYLKQQFGQSFDILYKEKEIGSNSFLFIMTDGMCNSMLVDEEIIEPVLNCDKLPKSPEKALNYISSNIVTSIDYMVNYDMFEAVKNILSGYLVIFCDGANFCISFGAQGFPKRPVMQSDSEVNERGSREAFTENFKDNVALLRRRFRSPNLRIELTELGNTSQTRICFCYLSDRVNTELLSELKQKINTALSDVVLCSGNVAEILESKRFSFFSSVGTTERPDVASAEMGEGRIIIMVDGTPFVLIIPYLFIENFQTVDDYAFRPFYALFSRLIKYFSFFAAIFLPSIYIAVCTFHQEILPANMLYDMAVQESITPFPVMLETIFIHFIYEIVREAGVRMPKSVGQAVSIVGGLVIGDAAVSAGLIAAPMLIVVALSAITSFVIPKLYQPVAVLRFIFMIIAGVFGFYGIAIGAVILLINTCSQNPYNVPYTTPIAPFSLGAMRDSIVRLSYKFIGKKSLQIKNMEK